MTQNEKVLRHMQDFGSITSMDAFTEYGCTRLSARIKDLRDAGISINATRETRVNRYGEKVSFARYSIGGGNVKEQVRAGSV